MIARMPTVNSRAKVSISRTVYCKNVVKKIINFHNFAYHDKNVSIILERSTASTECDNERSQTDEDEGPCEKLQECIVELVQ